MSYNYNSSDPIKIKLSDLEERERSLLSESKTFCMYPWIHLHAYPTGEAYPCCHAEMGVGQVGNCKTNTMTERFGIAQNKSNCVKTCSLKQKIQHVDVVMNRRNQASSQVDKVQTSITDITYTERKTPQKMVNTKILK